MTKQNALVILFVLIVNLLVLLFGRKAKHLFSSFEALPIFRFVIVLVQFLWIFGVWFGVFVVYKLPISGDVHASFQPWGTIAWTSGIVEDALKCGYLPLFPLVMGVVNHFSSDPRAIGFFFACCLAISVVLLRLMIRLDSETYSSFYTLLGILNGAIAVLAIGYQQDESWLLLLLELSIMLVVSQKDYLAGICMGFGFLATKALYAIFFVPLFFVSRRRQLFILGLITVCIPFFAIFWGLLGHSPWEIFFAQSGAMTPPSLTTLLSVHHGLSNILQQHSLLTRVIMGIGIVCIALLISPSRSVHPRVVFSAVALCWMVFLLLSPKSLSSYRIPILVILPWLLNLFEGPVGKDLVWSIYNSALAVQYMWYEDYIRGQFFPYFKYISFVKTTGILEWHVLIGLILDVIILSSECYFIWHLVSRLKNSTPSALSQPANSCKDTIYE